MRCVCCNKKINDRAKNTELCYDCLSVVNNYWNVDHTKNSDVVSLTDEEIEYLYVNKQFNQIIYD